MTEWIYTASGVLNETTQQGPVQIAASFDTTNTAISAEPCAAKLKGDDTVFFGTTACVGCLSCTLVDVVMPHASSLDADISHLYVTWIMIYNPVCFAHEV